MNCLRRSLNNLLQKTKNLGVNSFCQLTSEKSASALNEESNFSDLANPKEPSYERSSNFILERPLNISSPSYVKPREVWVENLDKIKEEKRGIVNLHPKIFGTIPRLDIIFENVKWQTKYKTVITYSAPTRAERPGGGRKPYPQKGMGKARHGSIRAPQFRGGGKAHGPRNPTSYYYMLKYHLRIHGLTSTLSAKFAQDDIRVIEDLNMPTDDSQYILDLIKERKWGPSVLFVDDTDIMPRNITIATENIGHVTLMPVYGLNIISMLKHDTLVLTLAAVNEIEDKLLTLINTANPLLAEEFHDS